MGGAFNGKRSKFVANVIKVVSVVKIVSVAKININRTGLDSNRAEA